MFWDVTRTYAKLEYNILDEIPGTQFWNKAVKIGDFDGDGLDEILIIHPSQSECYIMKYSHKSMVYTLSHTFEIPSPKGPPPIIFTKSYRESDCIAVLARDQMAERDVWVFFSLEKRDDGGEGRYTKVAEIWADEIDFPIIGYTKGRKTK
jgi:hypothetical protein